MSDTWRAEFRERMDAFHAQRPGGSVPVSIKVRVTSGCFHREHSPEAYSIIDDYLARADLSDIQHQVIEHESGPEVLVYLGLTTAGLSLAASVINLVAAIIKARSDGIKRGDTPEDPLELIVRGHSKDGEYTEERIMRIPAGTIITPKQLQAAFPKEKKFAPTKKRKKK